MNRRIWLSPPHLTGEEQTAAANVLASNWIAPVGPHLDALEQELCAATGASYVLALSSGTAALHLAMVLLGIGPGDEVAVPAATFIATANPVMYQGARPVFVDSSAGHHGMCPQALEDCLKAKAAAGKLPKAVVVAHLYGDAAMLPELAAVCTKYELPLIEDAAESLGATHSGSHTGTAGRYGVYSFNGNKIITASAGGALVLPDEASYSRALHLATQAKDPAPWYQHSTTGYNYRMSNVLAALLLPQLRALNSRVQARRGIFDRYVQTLGQLPGVAFLPELPGSYSSRWLTVLLANPALTGGIGRDDLYSLLEAQGIESRPVWKPLHTQPVFAGYEYWGGANAEDFFAQGLCLPSGSALTAAEQQEITGLLARLWVQAGVPVA